MPHISNIHYHSSSLCHRQLLHLNPVAPVNPLMKVNVLGCHSPPCKIPTITISINITACSRALNWSGAADSPLVQRWTAVLTQLSFSLMARRTAYCPVTKTQTYQFEMLRPPWGFSPGIPKSLLTFPLRRLKPSLKSIKSTSEVVWDVMEVLDGHVYLYIFLTFFCCSFTEQKTL